MTVRTTATVRRRAGRPRADEVGERMDELLSATERLLVRHGYGEATLNLIAREAGVSKQTIYAKFGGKPGLIRAMLQRMSERSRSAATFGADDELPLYDGLLHRVRLLFALNNSESGVAIITISRREARAFPEFHREMEDARQRYFIEPLVRYLDSLQRRGLARPVDSARLADALVWSVSQDAVTAASTGRWPPAAPEEVEAKAQFLARLFADALRPA